METIRRKELLRTRDLIFGILGCLCLSIGDWLLGFVPTGSIGSGTFYFLQEGHGAAYSDLRITLTVTLAAVGAFFLYPGLQCMANIARAEKDRKRLSYLFAMLFAGALMLHFIVAFHVLVFTDADSISRADAIRMSASANKVLYPAFCISYVPIYGSVLVLFILILKKKTWLKPAAAVFSPLIPMGILFVIAQILPSGAFSYGLFTFCMNFGLLVWYAYLLVWRR